MIRDEEFKRLIKYAQGLNIKVEMKPYIPYSKDTATWDWDGSTIEIFEKSSKSKTDLILDLLHELAHHLYWVDLGKTFPHELNEAYDLETIKQDHEVIDKKHRKQIYMFEKNSTLYHRYIYDAVGLKVPLYKLYLEMELSNWIYYRYYIKGKYPTIKSIRKKNKELTKRFKNESFN